MLGIIFLCSFDPPGRINDQHLELTHFLNEEFPVEIPDICLDECLISMVVSSLIDG